MKHGGVDCPLNGSDGSPARTHARSPPTPARPQPRSPPLAAASRPGGWGVCSGAWDGSHRNSTDHADIVLGVQKV